MQGEAYFMLRKTGKAYALPHEFEFNCNFDVMFMEVLSTARVNANVTYYVR